MILLILNLRTTYTRYLFWYNMAPGTYYVVYICMIPGIDYVYRVQNATEIEYLVHFYL